MTTPATPSPLALEMKTSLEQLREAHKGFAPKSELTELSTKYTKLQTQVDAMDLAQATKLIGGNFGFSLTEHLHKHDQVARLIRERRGRAVVTFSGAELATLTRKSIISGTATGVSEGDPLNPVGTMISGVLPIDRSPGITAEARQVLKIRDVLTARPTTMAVVDFVKVTTPMSPGQMVPEASTKPENQAGFTSISEKVRLIATTIPATKQVLDDFQELLGFIQTSLVYYINLEEEIQLLAGDDSGENLHGLIPQAALYVPTYLNATEGWTFIDVIGTAVQQINAAKEIDPTFVVLNTNDWWTIRLTKDGFQRYILGDPQAMIRPSIFGLDVVSTTTMPQGQFLVGSGNPAATQIRDRMELTVEISTEHSDFFVRNLCMLRAEKRLALVTPRPNSFVSGTFTRSPA
jgi:HK97 family phage major capsid protein